MKISLVLLMGALMLLLMPSVFAGAQKVYGTVYDQQSNPVAGADVSVTCNSITQTDVTNAIGDFKVSYNYPQCLPGSTVFVYATANGASGTASGIMQDGPGTRFAIALVNVTIPEFSTLTAAVAFFLAGSGYLFLRRKQK